MRQRSKIVLWGLLGSSAVVVAIVAYVFVAARYFDSCGISESQARSMVLEHLASKDRAAEPRLNYYQHRGTCEHAFYYKGPAGEFDFVVIDDPGHGVTLTWWDFAREEAAQQQSVCARTPLTEARSLETLPRQLNSVLGRDRGGLEGIADRNGKFNVTDVVDDKLPMRRFVLAGLSASCAIVAVERGGRAHTYEVVAFEHINARWRVAQRWSMNAAPRSLQELVAHVNK